MPRERSVIDPAYSYSNNLWIVSFLNFLGTGDTCADDVEDQHNNSYKQGTSGPLNLFFSGQAAIVVEGFKIVDDKPQKFIGEYYIKAMQWGKPKLSGINKIGYITKIRCFENDQNILHYCSKKFLHRSHNVLVTNAKKMIEAIKKDAVQTEKAWENKERPQRLPPLNVDANGKAITFLPYQFIGMNHPLVKLFGRSADGDNCAGWCLQKMKIAGIGDGTGKPTPFWQTCFSTVASKFRSPHPSQDKDTSPQISEEDAQGSVPKST